MDADADTAHGPPDCHDPHAQRLSAISDFIGATLRDPDWATDVGLARIKWSVDLYWQTLHEAAATRYRQRQRELQRQQINEETD